MKVRWVEGIRDTPEFRAYVFEIWVDNVLWYWTNVRRDGVATYKMLIKIMEE